MRLGVNGRTLVGYRKMASPPIAVLFSGLQRLSWEIAYRTQESQYWLSDAATAQKKVIAALKNGSGRIYMVLEALEISRPGRRRVPA